MRNFIFDCRTKVIFGKGTEKTVGDHMRQLGSKVLFHHYGEGYIKECGLYDDYGFLEQSGTGGD